MARCHDGRAQRWWVVLSPAAFERAAATLTQARQRAAEASAKDLLHLQARRVATSEAAQGALAATAQRWKSHQIAPTTCLESKRDGSKGRPTSTTPLKALEWPILAQGRPDDARLERRKHFKAWFVLGTNIEARLLSDAEGIRAYKGHARGEGRFRFLKAPLFFVSSLFVKKPARIQGRLMVMTLALLGYSVAQRRLRPHLARHNETVPNQINHPTERPTVRWVLQLREGIHRVRVTVHGHVHDLIEGLNDVKITVLRLFGEGVCQLYQISPG